MGILKETITINQLLANQLTKHEFKVILLMVEGETTASISQKLEIKVNTVSTLKKMIFLKLGVNINIPLYQAINEYC